MFDRAKAWAKAHPRAALITVAVVLIAGIAAGTQHSSPLTPSASPATFTPSPTSTPNVAAQVAAAQRRARRQAVREALREANSPRKVYFEVKGSTDGATVTFTTTGGGTGQRTVRVTGQWGYVSVARMSPGDFAYISAQNEESYGSVACRIVADSASGEETVAPTSWASGAYAIASCQGTV